ncbi:E3 ubiquitin-protein ligase TRIM39-like isoform X2 [Archocentrus centrarchus]|nr:E3 ubiquitin-protein ligase TRIM39-like isoform X2 [Archocentrus centrarchus]
MDSASSLLCEEQFLCSICLHDFTDPVSTPCGHNYCKNCITEYWDNSNVTQCPLCKKRFRRRPQLQVNTEFRDMVKHISSMRVKGGEEDLAKPGEVPCDVCDGPKRKAHKTCLVCLTSYCQTDLEPHQRVASLKKHKLIDPVSNLKDRVCQKHDKLLELFCCTDQVCICFMCLKDDHVTHETAPLERAFREKKAWLENVTSEMKEMENTKSGHVKEAKHSAQQNKEESERELADIVEVLGALVSSLLKRQDELIKLIQKKHKEVEKQAESHIAQLEEEVVELRRKRSKLTQYLQTEDHLHFLQSCPSLQHHALNEDLFDPLSLSAPPFIHCLSKMSLQIYVGMVKKYVALMERTLGNEMGVLIHELKLSDDCDAAEQADAAELLRDDFIQEDWFLRDDLYEEEWKPPQDKLMMIQQYDWMDVSFNGYIAHPKLMVCEGGKKLMLRTHERPFSPLFERVFLNQPYVLATEGFSSGRFYYEVCVSGSKAWMLGVVKESVSMLMGFPPKDEEGAWTLSAKYTESEEQYFTCNDFPLLHVRQRPQRVGVFVDYENEEVAFYDVDARTLMYSFRECTFNENPSVLKALLYSVAGFSLSNRPKLYPIFGIFPVGCDYDNTLVITPVGIAT